MTRKRWAIAVVVVMLALGIVGMISRRAHTQAMGEAEPTVSVSPPAYELYIPMNGEELLSVLKYYFPNVRIWGVVDDIYESVPVSEMKRFLAADMTNRMFVGRTYKHREYLDIDDYAARLWGNMSHDHGWERIPFGIIGRGKRGYNIPEKMPLTNIFATKEGNRVILYEINPMTDQIQEITYRQRDVLIVLI